MKTTSKRVEFGFIQMETCTLVSVMAFAGVLQERAASLLKPGVPLDQGHRCAAVEQDYQEMHQDILKNVYV